MREIDDSAVSHEQLDSLRRIKASRDNRAVKTALQEITIAAAGKGNLLDRAVKAARVRATVGEISDAMEEVFGRYQQRTHCVTGVVAKVFAQNPQTKAEFDGVKVRVAEFAQRNGRPPRLLIAKMGQDGHDRGAKVIASAYSDLGFAVDFSPMFSTPEEIASLAAANNADLIGASSLAAGHKTLLPELTAQLRAIGREDIKVVVGGVIPPHDYDFLYRHDVKAIFCHGTRMLDSASRSLDLIMGIAGMEAGSRH